MRNTYLVFHGPRLCAILRPNELQLRQQRTIERSYWSRHRCILTVEERDRRRPIRVVPRYFRIPDSRSACRTTRTRETGFSRASTESKRFPDNWPKYARLPRFPYRSLDKRNTEHVHYRTAFHIAERKRVIIPHTMRYEGEIRIR
jgi:hypothetical protein